MNACDAMHMASFSDSMIVAIPSKGRLKSHVQDFLMHRGFQCVQENERQLQAKLVRPVPCSAVYLHPKDIPVFLEKKFISVGFTGLDILYELQSKMQPVIRLNTAHVKMAILVPEQSTVSHPFHLINRTVASPYQHIARAYFKKMQIPITIHAIQGTSEIIPALGIADAIVDVVETGTSARENGLRIVIDTLFDSECVCVVDHPEWSPHYEKINLFLQAIY